VQTTYWTTVKYKAGERIQIIHAPSADPLWESSSTAKYVGECTPIIHAPTADPLRESSSTVKYEAGERTRIIHAHVHVVRFPMPLSTKYIPEQAFVEGMEGGGEVDEQKPSPFHKYSPDEHDRWVRRTCHDKCGQRGLFGGLEGVHLRGRAKVGTAPNIPPTLPYHHA
jgi:hypothetical protein